MTFPRRCSAPFRPLLLAVSATALPFLAGANPLEAQRGDFHIGASYGIADVEVRSSGAYDQIVDGDENVLSYEIGYRFNPSVGIEASYHDLSKVDASIVSCARGNTVCSEVDAKADLTALTLSLVPSYQITGRVLLFAKVGLVSWGGDLDEARDLDISPEDLDKGDTLFGAGVQVRLIAGLDAVTQWQSFGDIEILSAGLRLTF